MDDKEKLQLIKQEIREGEQLGVSPSEIFGSIEHLLPEKTIYIEKPVKSSPETLEYMKNYRLMRKKMELMKAQTNNKELALQKRINRAKQRSSFHCYKCKLGVKATPEFNEHTFEKKRSDPRTKLIISNKCPHCSGIVRAFGSYIQAEDMVYPKE